jgi:hypothetical protein
MIAEAITSACCPVCDRPIPMRASKGPLMVMSEPWRVFWHGKAVEHFEPMQVRFLYLLLSFGRVSLGALEMYVREDSCKKAVSQQITKLRAKLRAAQIPATILSLHGWGYELEIHE